MVAVRAAYVDASALVKLVVAEPASAALRDYLEDVSEIVTSRISFVEVSRAVGRRDDVVGSALDLLLRSVSYREVDETVIVAAAALRPPALRTLDAIHLASAMALGARLDAFVTYDSRLAEAARLHALPVVAPGP